MNLIAFATSSGRRVYVKEVLAIFQKIRPAVAAEIS